MTPHHFSLKKWPNSTETGSKITKICHSFYTKCHSKDLWTATPQGHLLEKYWTSYYCLIHCTLSFRVDFQAEINKLKSTVKQILTVQSETHARSNLMFAFKQQISKHTQYDFMQISAVKMQIRNNKCFQI